MPEMQVRSLGQEDPLEEGVRMFHLWLVHGPASTCYLRASHLGLTPDLRMPPALTACCLEVCLLSQNHGLEVRWPGFQSQLLRFPCDFRPSRFIVMATLRDEQVSIREVFRTLGG